MERVTRAQSSNRIGAQASGAFVRPRQASNSAGLAAAVFLVAIGAIRAPNQILKMKKFPMSASRPKDNVDVSEAINVLQGRRAGCVIR
jgi:hypothetical protein